MTLRSGSVLGRYRLEQLLGTGGMASVWRARDERLGRTVAVKVLSETLALDRDYVRRFNREAQIAAGLSHPNLVTVFDYDIEDDRPYLVSEYVQGGTLAERIESGTAIDAGRLAPQLLGALSHIHAAGIIHRDVKPANVLIDTDGRSRLTDFGVAQPSDETGLTEPGKVIGTLAYMAPEVRAGEPASERSDLYSTGVLLGECLGGDPDPRLVALVDELTTEDPAGRPRSASAALKLLDSEPRSPALAVTRPLPQTGPTRRIPRAGTASPAAWPRTAAAIAALLAVLLAGFVFAQSLGGDEGSEQLAGAGERPKPRTVTVAAPPPQTQPATTALDSCAALEQEKAALEEERKAAVEFAPDDEKKAIEERFKEREKALEEQLKACEGDDGGSSGPGRSGGPDGEGPPGQLMKDGEDD